MSTTVPSYFRYLKRVCGAAPSTVRGWGPSTHSFDDHALCCDTLYQDQKWQVLPGISLGIRGGVETYVGLQCRHP